MLGIPEKYQDKINTYFDCSDDEYHNEIPLISFHGLKECLQSFNHFLAAKRNRSDSKAFTAGRAAHAMALQPEIFAQKYAIAPVCDRRTKEGKAKWEEFNAALTPGQEALSDAEGTMMAGMRLELAAARQIFPEMFRFQQVEKAGIFQLGEGPNKEPIYAKLKPDAIGEGFMIPEGDPRFPGLPLDYFKDGFILDYKTTQDNAWRWNFGRDARKFYYDCQLFFYQMGDGTIMNRRLPLVILAQEKADPYEWMFYVVDQSNEESASQILTRAYQKFYHGVTMIQPGYPREIAFLDVQRGGDFL